MLCVSFYWVFNLSLFSSHALNFFLFLSTVFILFMTHVWWVCFISPARSTPVVPCRCDKSESWCSSSMKFFLVCCFYPFFAISSPWKISPKSHSFDIFEDRCCYFLFVKLDLFIFSWRLLLSTCSQMVVRITRSVFLLIQRAPIVILYSASSLYATIAISLRECIFQLDLSTLINFYSIAILKNSKYTTGVCTKFFAQRTNI